MIGETHLTRTQSCRISVSPSGFDALATSPCGSKRVIEIEGTFAVFAVCFKVKLWYDESDSKIIWKLIDVTIDVLEALPEID